MRANDPQYPACLSPGEVIEAQAARKPIERVRREPPERA